MGGGGCFLGVSGRGCSRRGSNVCVVVEGVVII